MSWTFQPLLIASQEAPGVQLLAGTISASSSIPNVPFIRRTREVAGSFGATSNVPNVPYVHRIRRIIGVPIQGISGVSANLIIYTPPVLLAGAIGSSALIEGVAKRLRRLLGISEAFSSAVGVLRARKRLVGSSAAVSSIGGTLKVTKKLASATGTASYVNESFETTKPTRDGCDESFWTVTQGSGCTVDTDNTDVSPPPGGGSQVLKMIGNGNGVNNFVRGYIPGGQKSDTWTTVCIRLAALTDGHSFYALQTQDSAWTEQFAIAFLRSGSAYTLRVNIRNNGGAQQVVNKSVSLDTWYKVDIKYDRTNTAYEVLVDDVSEASGSLTGDYALGLYFITMYGMWWYDGFSCTAYWDRIWIDDSEYGYGAGVSAVSSLTGSLKRTKVLAGVVNAVSSVSGLLKKTARLFGTIDSVSSVVGNLIVSAGAKALAGVIAAVSSITGLVKVDKKFFGTSASASVVGGIVKRIRRFVDWVE